MSTTHKKYLPNIFFFLVPFLLIASIAPNLEFYLRSADHGVQLVLANHILMGKFPFIDIFFYYGPLIGFTSAIGIWTGTPLIFETIICSAGYALCLYLLYFLSNRYISVFAGYLSPLLGFIYLPRFYKWYYWLFPLLALYIFHTLINTSTKKTRLKLFVAGLVGSIAGLYRLDLTLLFFCFFFSLSYLFIKNQRPIQYLQHLAIFIIGLAIPFLLWFFILIVLGGNINDYIDATWSGSFGVVHHLSLPFPKIDWGSVFTKSTGAVVAFYILPATYLLCILYGLWKILYRSNSNLQQYKFIIAVGLLGLGLYPQAIHRSDVQHLLQVLPPIFIAGPILINKLWNWPLNTNNHSLIYYASRFLLLIYVGLFILSGWSIYSYAQSDFSNWNSSLLLRLKRLQFGIQSDLNNPTTQLINKIQDITKKDETIIVAIPLAAQLLYFANRQTSDLMAVYTPGVLDSESWRARNLETVKNNLPKIIITEHNFFELPDSNLFKKYRPELYELLSSLYKNIIYNEDGYMILERETN